METAIYKRLVQVAAGMAPVTHQFTDRRHKLFFNTGAKVAHGIRRVREYYQKCLYLQTEILDSSRTTKSHNEELLTSHSPDMPFLFMREGTGGRPRFHAL